jgi:hypothetical protein
LHSAGSALRFGQNVARAFRDEISSDASAQFRRVGEKPAALCLNGA